MRVHAPANDLVRILADQQARWQLPPRAPPALRERLDHQQRELVRVAGLLQTVRAEGVDGGLDAGAQVVDDVRGAQMVALRQEVGARVARLDGGDLDAEVGDLAAQRLRDQRGARLGRAVDAGARRAAPAADAAHVGDDAAALPAHEREHGAQDVELPEDVGAERRLHLGAAAFLHPAREDVAGVVDEHVDAPVRARRDLLDGCGEGDVRGRHVETLGEGAALRERAQLRRVAGRGDDDVASLEGRERDGVA